MTTWSLFGNGDPGSGQFTDGLGLTLGTRIIIGVDGNLTGLKWWFPTPIPSNQVQWFVSHYDPSNDSTSLGTYANGTFPVGATPGAWNTVNFGPIAVTAGTQIVAEVFTIDRYTAISHYFDSGHTVGPLTGPADDAVTPRHNGRFHNAGTPAYPTDGFNATSYFVDILFDDGINPPSGAFVGDDGLQCQHLEEW